MLPVQCDVYGAPVHVPPAVDFLSKRKSNQHFLIVQRILSDRLHGTRLQDADNILRRDFPRVESEGCIRYWLFTLLRSSAFSSSIKTSRRMRVPTLRDVYAQLLCLSGALISDGKRLR